ncbi:DUF3397 domain-containing protein [Listeria aquatica]|uniref:DUF3397 domain-containing protein n=1 Tax=Listeria aquatica TaxID=1494960 RepID=A0A841ZJU1_9LIST|nr:DUF3397 family protein [Listeria aquatica]MBC1520446.1 DUF3397 domain-containing protein [Listeria aquatica]
MLNWTTEMSAWLMVCPVFLFFFFYLGLKWGLKSQPRALKWSADLTTFFFILADHFWMVQLFGRSFLLYILLVLFLVGIGIVVIFALRDGELRLARVFRTYWRICFFIFALFYLFFYLTGLILAISYQ